MKQHQWNRRRVEAGRMVGSSWTAPRHSEHSRAHFFYSFHMVDHCPPSCRHDANRQRSLLIDHSLVAFKSSIPFKGPLKTRNICLPAVWSCVMAVTQQRGRRWTGLTRSQTFCLVFILRRILMCSVGSCQHWPVHHCFLFVLYSSFNKSESQPTNSLQHKYWFTFVITVFIQGLLGPVML